MDYPSLPVLFRKIVSLPCAVSSFGFYCYAYGTIFCPVHTPTSHLRKIHLLSTIYSWVSQVVSFPHVSTPKPCIHLSSPPICATCSAHLIFLDFITRTILLFLINANRKGRVSLLWVTLHFSTTCHHWQCLGQQQYRAISKRITGRSKVNAEKFCLFKNCT